MSTQRTFQDMLNEYLPNKLLKEEMIKRDFILSNCEKDDSWKGGKIIVPFKAAGASSIKMGGLTAANDVSEDQYIRGSIDAYKEAWGTMLFNHRDLMDHSGKVVEDSFLKILPDSIEDFMDVMKMTVSVQLGTGPAFSVVTDATNAATGVMLVTHVDRFQLGMKAQIDDDNSSPLDVYVIAINVNGGAGNIGAVTFSATRGGAFVDLSAYTVAQNAKFYTDGAQSESFTSIKSVLLSAANGGSANVHGKSKLAYPYLQAVNVAGSSITAANILDQLFDAYTTVRQKAKGKADTFLMSYKHLGSIMKLLESKANGAANWQIKDEGRKASIYGWDEILVTSVKGTLKIVGIQEWDDDVIAIMNMKAMTFRSNGFFQKRKAPDGKEYFEVRNTTGYQYLLDICLFGELEFTKPGECGIIYGISY